MQACEGGILIKKNMRKYLDSEIWQRFRKGDEKAFSYIFDTYHLQLFEYGQRFSSDPELVGDSIQDLFFELAGKREKLSATDNILFYLLKSLRIKIFNNLRKNRYTNSSIRPEQLEEFRLEYSTEVDTEEKELRLDRLAEAINQLPPRQKETIYLKFYKNLSNAAILSKIGNVMKAPDDYKQNNWHVGKILIDGAVLP